MNQKRNPLHPDEEHYVCPRCGSRGTWREFHTLGITPEYAQYCVPVRICPRDGCYHKFAPIPDRWLAGEHDNE